MGKVADPVVRLVAALAATLIFVAGTPTIAHAADDEDPTRILIVGDSVTNGSVGDYTWRYRLWNNLTGPGAADVDFVGPNTGVLDDQLKTTNAMEYADPDFDVDHAARWGMSLAFPDHPVGELVEEYDADVAVEFMGLNDLTWLGVSADGVAAMARQFVEDVRAANPVAVVVLCQLPQSWIAKVPEFNGLLDQVAAELDTPDARVVVAHAADDFTRDVDTWDIGHPSATGEVKIARSIAAALAGVGVGAAPDEFPAVVNGPAARPGLKLGWDRAGAPRLSWRLPLGATGVKVWRRDVTARGPWVVVEPDTRVEVPAPGRTLQWRVQAFKGSAVSPLFSRPVSVRGRA